MKGPTTMRLRKGLYALTTVAVLGVASVTMIACEKDGPSERAGEELDELADNIDDKIDPKGPVEKAGRAIDRAVDD